MLSMMSSLTKFLAATNSPSFLTQRPSLKINYKKIAAEFNFSEVTFVYPPENSDHTVKVRIFTPTSEVDFAGHPVIGTIIALAKLGYNAPMVLELGVGPLACTLKNGMAAFTATLPLQKIVAPRPELVAKALCLPASAINQKTHAPIQASLGLPFAIVELDSRNSLAKCQPKTEVIRECAALYPAGLDFAIFAYIRDGDKITSRMFAPLDNICLLYTSPSPRDQRGPRMPSSA